MEMRHIMIPIWKMIRSIYHEEAYIWIDVLLIKETEKAILIMFNGKKEWLPKAWISEFRYIKNAPKIKVKISQYRWAKKFY